MTHPFRSALPPRLLVAGLLGVALTACSTGAFPSDASEEDFCAAQGKLFTDLDLGGEGPAPTTDEIVDSLHDWADDVAEVGTPAGMPADARAGFERAVELARAADPEDFDEDGTPAIPEDRSAESEEQAQAFTTYVARTCGAGDAESGLPEVPELSSEG